MSKFRIDLGYAGYLRPPIAEIEQYAKRLYNRRAEGILVQRQVVEVNGWRPDANDCHTNAKTLAAVVEGYRAVNGWLFFDFDGAFAYVRFTAHSMVESPTGDLIDIIPPPAARPNAGVYPFVRAQLPPEQYQGLVDALLSAHGIAHLDCGYRPA